MPFFADPLPPPRLVGELLRGHRYPGLIPQRRHRPECGNDIVPPELDHQIDILSKPQITVRVHGEPAGDEIAHAGSFEGCDDGLEAGQLHGPRLLRNGRQDRITTPSLALPLVKGGEAGIRGACHRAAGRPTRCNGLGRMGWGSRRSGYWPALR